MKGWIEVPLLQPKESARTAPADNGEAVHDGMPSFAPRKPLRSMRDLVVPQAVRHRIDLALSQVENHEILYHQWNLKKIDPYRTGTAVNFYGPSGTGKSLAAEAIAHHRGQPLIDVSYAEIESKYVGDTPKNIESCFRQAAAHDAVLVFNEADSILGSRLSHVTQSSDHSVNVSRAVMLSQLDAFGGLVVFTTNFPRNYDAAFVRRILIHVRFDLPDETTRRILWETLIPAEIPRAESLDVTVLAESSEGLVGGDMVNALMAATALAVSRHGADRVLRIDDLLAEIEAIRQAKSEVGKSLAREVRVISPTRADGTGGTDEQPVCLRRSRLPALGRQTGEVPRLQPVRSGVDQAAGHLEPVSDPIAALRVVGQPDVTHAAEIGHLAMIADDEDKSPLRLGGQRHSQLKKDVWPGLHRVRSLSGRFVQLAQVGMEVDDILRCQQYDGGRGQFQPLADGLAEEGCHLSCCLDQFLPLQWAQVKGP